MNRLQEPVLVVTTGGMVLVQAVIHLLMTFHVHITPEQEAAITTVASLLLAAIARTQVVPTNTLPAGVADQMANSKAAKAAEKAGT